MSLLDAETELFLFAASVFRHTSFRFSKLFFTGNDIRTTKSHFLSNTFYSSLLVPFRYASSLCDANLVEPWFRETYRSQNNYDERFGYRVKAANL